MSGQVLPFTKRQLDDLKSFLDDAFTFSDVQTFVFIYQDSNGEVYYCDNASNDDVLLMGLLEMVKTGILLSYVSGDDE